MTGKEYMHEIRIVRRKIKLLEEQIERDRILAAGVSGIRYDKDIVQTSPDSDRMTDIVANIVEATGKLKEEIYHLQLKEEEAINFLVQLKEEHERALSYHYLDGRDWSDIARIMNYERQSIYDVKDRALDELTRVIETSDKNRPLPTVEMLI